MSKTFHTLNGRILIERVEEKTGEDALIYIPESAKEKPTIGNVISGNDDLAVGDKVLFGKYAGTEINIDNKDLIILNEKEILGVWR